MDLSLVSMINIRTKPNILFALFAAPFESCENQASDVILTMLLNFMSLTLKLNLLFCPNLKNRALVCFKDVPSIRPRWLCAQTFLEALPVLSMRIKLQSSHMARICKARLITDKTTLDAVGGLPGQMSAELPGRTFFFFGGGENLMVAVVLVSILMTLMLEVPLGMSSWSPPSHPEGRRWLGRYH